MSDNAIIYRFIYKHVFACFQLTKVIRELLISRDKMHFIDSSINNSCKQLNHKPPQPYAFSHEGR